MSRALVKPAKGTHTRLPSSHQSLLSGSPNVEVRGAIVHAIAVLEAPRKQQPPFVGGFTHACCCLWLFVLWGPPVFICLRGCEHNHQQS